MLYLEHLCCCCYSRSISNMMCGVRNFFLVFCGGLLDGALSSSLHNLLFLVANIFWIVLGILCIWANGISCPLLLLVMILFFRFILKIQLRCLFIMGLEAVCAPFPPRLLWCIRLRMQWCKVPIVRLMLLMSWRVWLCVRCWELRRCFGVSLIRWIKIIARLLSS